jgi:DNA-binding MurR/RpiR family transcriptional regulator
MDHGPLADRIIKAFDTMSGQLQTGARFVLERPRDVALLSMREQARRAGVQPATMTRLAKHLGMDGYDRVRELYAAAVRDGDIGFAGLRARSLRGTRRWRRKCCVRSASRSSTW